MSKIKESLKNLFFPPKKEAGDSFQYEDQVLAALLHKMDQLYGGRQKGLEGNKLVLWIADEGSRALIERCHDRVLTSLHDERMPVADVEIGEGPLPEGATPFYEGFAYKVVDPQDEEEKQEKEEEVPLPAAQSATLRVHDKKGSMKKSCYRLTSEGGVYRIGRDATGENAISIVGNPESKQYNELNCYVRSRHARIAYVRGVGFCLFVERDGTEDFGKSRTQLRQANGKVLLELNNPQLPVPLHDGDVIVLGKHVELEWKEEQ